MFDFRKLAALALLISLSACAGYHSVPPANYSLVNDAPVERIVFDQDGDPYPRSNDPSGISIPARPPNKNTAMKLKAVYRDARPPYDREALLDQSAQRIVSGMKAANANRVVFLIKGFNNSYGSLDEEYVWMRDEIIGSNRANGLYFVQVYWDAIHKGKGTFFMPGAYFADSMTYSNHAGDCGLRDLMRRLPAGTDITFLTHSRGAAVALASVSDAKYDPDISNECESKKPEHALVRGLGDVRLVAFAPAIGDGHVREGMDPRIDIYDTIDRFYVGFNPNDPAVTKTYFGISISDRFAGDTRLGGNTSYINALDAKLATKGFAEQFQTVKFTRKSHAWRDYVALREAADCMLWVGRLISAQPATCKLTQ